MAKAALHDEHADADVPRTKRRRCFFCTLLLLYIAATAAFLAGFVMYMVGGFQGHDRINNIVELLRSRTFPCAGNGGNWQCGGGDFASGVDTWMIVTSIIIAVIGGLGFLLLWTRLPAQRTGREGCCTGWFARFGQGLDTIVLVLNYLLVLLLVGSIIAVMLLIGALLVTKYDARTVVSANGSTPAGIALQPFQQFLGTCPALQAGGAFTPGEPGCPDTCPYSCVDYSKYDDIIEISNCLCGNDQILSLEDEADSGVYHAIITLIGACIILLGVVALLCFLSADAAHLGAMGSHGAVSGAVVTGAAQHTSKADKKAAKLEAKRAAKEAKAAEKAARKAGHTTTVPVYTSGVAPAYTASTAPATTTAAYETADVPAAGAPDYVPYGGSEQYGAWDGSANAPAGTQQTAFVRD